jgi:hypothetical protein
MDIIEFFEEQQYESFKLLIKDKMSINFYLCIFLGTFLGDEYFPASIEDFNEMQKISDKSTNNFDNVLRQYCCQIINQTDLCESEMIFFRAITEIYQSNNFIDQCIKKYHDVSSLYQVEPIPNILKCLEASKNIEFN